MFKRVENQELKVIPNSGVFDLCNPSYILVTDGLIIPVGQQNVTGREIKATKQEVAEAETADVNYGEHFEDEVEGYGEALICTVEIIGTPYYLSECLGWGKPPFLTIKKGEKK